MVKRGGSLYRRLAPIKISHHGIEIENTLLLFPGGIQGWRAFGGCQMLAPQSGTMVLVQGADAIGDRGRRDQRIERQRGVGRILQLVQQVAAFLWKKYISKYRLFEILLFP